MTRWHPSHRHWTDDQKHNPDGNAGRQPFNHRCWRACGRCGLSLPTDRYPHNVLGDIPGHGALDVTLASGRVLRMVLPDTRVFEDIAPRLADIDGDGFLAAGYTEQNVLGVVLGIACKTFSNYVNHLGGTPVNDVLAPYKVD